MPTAASPPGYWYIHAWGLWFCMANGWVVDVSRVRAVSTPAAELISRVHPGAVVVEVSA